jgi:hypothetical protein
MSFKKFQKISISFFVVIFLLSTFYFLFSDRALAAEDATTIDLNCQTKPGAYPWCQEAQKGPSAFIGKFYIIALGLAAAAAFGVLIYGAILWTLSGAVTSKQDAKEWIWGAIWGLVLLLAAYLILWTINPDLIKLKSPEELFKIPAGLSVTPAPSVPPSPTPRAPGTLSDQQAKSQLDAAMIRYKSNVSFEGIRQKTIDEIKALSFDLQNKGIGIINEFVTSGTEGSHNEGTYSHANGYKFDLRMNDKLTNFIENNYTFIGTRSDGAPMYQNSRGAIYAKEGNHWDVLVK